jgi:hypothetical protein
VHHEVGSAESRNPKIPSRQSHLSRLGEERQTEIGSTQSPRGEPRPSDSSVTRDKEPATVAQVSPRYLSVIIQCNNVNKTCTVSEAHNTLMLVLQEHHLSAWVSTDWECSNIFAAKALSLKHKTLGSSALWI